MTGRGAPWWERARCLGMAPLFDAEGGRVRGRAAAKALAERLERAARVCAECPVRRECDADWRPGRDEGIRAGKVLPSIFEPRKGAW